MGRPWIAFLSKQLKHSENSMGWYIASQTPAPCVRQCNGAETNIYVREALQGGAGGALLRRQAPDIFLVAP